MLPPLLSLTDWPDAFDIADFTEPAADLWLILTPFGDFIAIEPLTFLALLPTLEIWFT